MSSPETLNGSVFMKLRLIASLPLALAVIAAVHAITGSLRLSDLLGAVDLLPLIASVSSASTAMVDIVALSLLVWIAILFVLTLVPVPSRTLRQTSIVDDDPSRILVDSPIDSPDDDVLGRREYVSALTQRLLASAQDGVIVAVNGAWGAGKSSVLNLVARNLRERDEVVTAWFRPWHYESLPSLIDALFESIAQATQPDAGWAARLSSSLPWSARARFRRHIRSARRALQGVRVEAVTLGAGPLALSVGRRRPEPVTRSLGLARQALTDANLHVVLFAEDLDRLSGEQARRFFSLLFSLRQLGRLTVVLPMDGVELRRVLGDDRHLIERLVDVDEPLPAIEQRQIEDFFFDKLDQIFSRHSITVTDEQRHDLREKSRAVLGRWMQDLRRAKHLLNAVSGTLGLAGAELHPVDLVVVEALRLAFPEVHRDLPGMWDTLTDAPPQMWLFGTEVEREARRKRLKDWLDRIYQHYSGKDESVEAFLEALFPGTPSFARGGGEPSVEYDQEAAGRIASHMNFSRYFLYRAELADIPNPEADRVVSAAALGSDDATEELNRFLAAHGTKGRLAVDRLMQRAQTIDVAHAEALTDAVVATSPGLSWDRGPLEVSQAERSQVLLWNMANRVQDPQGSIQRWLAEAPQLDYAIRLLVFLNPERNRVFTRWSDIDRDTLVDVLLRRVSGDPAALVNAQYRRAFLRLLGSNRATALITELVDNGVLAANEVLAWFLDESYGLDGEPVGRRINHDELLETFGVGGLRMLSDWSSPDAAFAADLARALRLGGDQDAAAESEIR